MSKHLRDKIGTADGWGEWRVAYSRGKKIKDHINKNGTSLVNKVEYRVIWFAILSLKNKTRTRSFDYAQDDREIKVILSRQTGTTLCHVEPTAGRVETSKPKAIDNIN